MAAVLPMLIQTSLLLFTIGLVLFLFYISKPSFGVTTAIFGIGVIYYAVTTTISVLLHPRLSTLLCHAFSTGCINLCMPISVQPLIIFSHRIWILPRQHIWVALAEGSRFPLKKFRPYSEKELENPITAATVDELQLSTAASALQRIYESVPNSPHSQLTHQSAWQVAGSPALRLRPLFNLPSYVIDRGNDAEHFARLPQQVWLV